jgi:hypothetical protein
MVPVWYRQTLAPSFWQAHALFDLGICVKHMLSRSGVVTAFEWTVAVLTFSCCCQRLPASSSRTLLSRVADAGLLPYCLYSINFSLFLTLQTGSGQAGQYKWELNGRKS